MLSVAALSLSGMDAAQAALDASAHNIANGDTKGFRRQLVTQSTVAGGGVATALTHAPDAGNALEADIVDQLVAKNAFLANLAVFRTSNKMLGSLLNIQG